MGGLHELRRRQHFFAVLAHFLQEYLGILHAAKPRSCHDGVGVPYSGIPHCLQ